MITNTFLICGFPRSRTLWMSKFLSVPGLSCCTHEATEHAGNANEFWKNAETFTQAVHARIYGNSDSANIFVLASMLAQKPLCKTVWIARPITEVCASMKAAKMDFNEQAARMLLRLRDDNRGFLDLFVDYDALNSMRTCQEVWEYVLPGVPFDLQRWRQFSVQNLAYRNGHPRPRQTEKFLGWVNQEMSQWQAY